MLDIILQVASNIHAFVKTLVEDCIDFSFGIRRTTRSRESVSIPLT
ncbi:hypothetical protein IQ230_25595 [Gloeocapsopsis crepidinum LEGE 06123]|uniref:Transposase n=1 Tax=Gloeocapsopsis crepidinum LEGE 06123 TaxID=588587 RepID=A0ABR9UZC4_9CHRO|nr:hypothetical protein [Gloeocapsopsis crepidinum]MBE9193631.1 hypothetical protein [Gloeocapsopsis crepidinum LEGE 06123]